MKNASGLPHERAKKIRAVSRFFRGRARALLCRGEEGQSLVEFALVLPMLVIALTGMVSFTLGMYSYQQLGVATATSAQQLGTLQGLLSDPCAKTVSVMTSMLPTWTPAKFTYTLTITDSSGVAHAYGPTAGSTFSCTAGAAQMAENQPISLKVSYQYTWFPILSFSPSGNLVASQAVMGQ
jgi:Flp pilus assembly protein TadG